VFHPPYNKCSIFKAAKSLKIIQFSESEEDKYAAATKTYISSAAHKISLLINFIVKKLPGTHIQ